MKIYITYDVITSLTLTVERDSIPENHEELLESVTRQELEDNEMDVAEVGWDNIKSAWRDSTPENTWVLDEDNNELYQETSTGDS
jgi:hypothetical protein|tara:strand:+ start:19 stop:273 length:255 start_codon:yes stop_codon:yes gene_type:complete